MKHHERLSKEELVQLNFSQLVEYIYEHGIGLPSGETWNTVEDGPSFRSMYKMAKEAFVPKITRSDAAIERLKFILQKNAGNYGESVAHELDRALNEAGTFGASYKLMATASNALACDMCVFGHAYLDITATGASPGDLYRQSALKAEQVKASLGGSAVRIAEVMANRNLGAIKDGKPIKNVRLLAASPASEDATPKFLESLIEKFSKDFSHLGVSVESIPKKETASFDPISIIIQRKDLSRTVITSERRDLLFSEQEMFRKLRDEPKSVAYFTMRAIEELTTLASEGERHFEIAFFDFSRSPVGDVELARLEAMRRVLRSKSASVIFSNVGGLISAMDPKRKVVQSRQNDPEYLKKSLRLAVKEFGSPSMPIIVRDPIFPKTSSEQRANLVGCVSFLILNGEIFDLLNKESMERDGSFDPYAISFSERQRNFDIDVMLGLASGVLSDVSDKAEGLRSFVESCAEEWLL